MQIKTLVSLLAVGTALAFASPASAQTMFNGAALSADDLPKVQARCDELKNSATESLAETTETPAAEASTTQTTTPADATVTNQTQANAADAATVGSLDLELVTIEMCTEAGLVTP